MKLLSTLLTGILLLRASAALSGDGPYTVSVSKGALAPNAGGQEAYNLRVHHAGAEAHVFLNKSLSVANQPLVGAGYDLRFDVCSDCFWKIFLGTGVGLSNAGPFLELNWGASLPLLPIWLPMDPPRYVPQLRIDFSTHVIFGQLRPNVWSYPLWIGIAVPF